MRLNDDPAILDAGPLESEVPIVEELRGPEAAPGWQWLVPWLLAFAGMLITLALTR